MLCAWRYAHVIYVAVCVLSQGGVDASRALRALGYQNLIAGVTGCFCLSISVLWSISSNSLRVFSKVT